MPPKDAHEGFVPMGACYLCGETDSYLLSRFCHKPNGSATVKVCIKCADLYTAGDASLRDFGNFFYTMRLYHLLREHRT